MFYKILFGLYLIIEHICPLNFYGLHVLLFSLFDYKQDYAETDLFENWWKNGTWFRVM